MSCFGPQCCVDISEDVHWCISWCIGVFHGALVYFMVHWCISPEGNRKFAMETRLFHATMQIHNLILRLWSGLWISPHTIFFLLLAVRPAQASFRPYGLKDAVYFSFCISGRKARNAYTSQAVRPEMCVKVDSGRKA